MPKKIIIDLTEYFRKYRIIKTLTLPEVAHQRKLLIRIEKLPIRIEINNCNVLTLLRKLIIEIQCYTYTIAYVIFSSSSCCYHLPV